MTLRRLAPWLVAAWLALSGLFLIFAAVFSLGLASWHETNVGLDKAGGSTPIQPLIEAGALDADKVLALAGHANETFANEGVRWRALNQYLFGDNLRREAASLRSRALWCAIVAAVNFLGCGALVASLRRAKPSP